jgi:hypothetical protein
MKSGRNKKTIFMTPNDFIADPMSLEMSNENDIKTLKNINHYYQNRGAIGQRLMELDEEWDIERMLELNTGLWAVIGIVLGITRNRVWLLLTLGAGALLARQALEGNSAAVPLLCKLGFRTRAEIDKEKYALKALRGDFKYLLDVPNVVWKAVNE